MVRVSEKDGRGRQPDYRPPRSLAQAAVEILVLRRSLRVDAESVVIRAGIGGTTGSSAPFVMPD